MDAVKLILVGGFLGSGKTTLLGKTARLLADSGKRVGLITNDQGKELVDTQILKKSGFDVNEVSGGCFCCRFQDLLSSAGDLIEQHKPDVLIGEPVGSCTDIRATVLRPLREFFPDRFAVAPFTVLVDPDRLRDMLAKDTASASLAEKVMYIYGKQLEEADVILLNKMDLLEEEETVELRKQLIERFPHTHVQAISALRSEGLDAWLQRLDAGKPRTDQELDIDYETYGEGEALLGWLNAAVRLSGDEDTRWKPVCMSLLKDLKNRFQELSAEVAHVKISLTAEETALVGNLTSTRGRPFLFVQGAEEHASKLAYLILNARVQIDPDPLKEAVEKSLASLGENLQVDVTKMECFSPDPPDPPMRGTRPGGGKACTFDPKSAKGVVANLFRPKGTPADPERDRSENE